MKIENRLWLSFFLMVIMPILLIATVLFYSVATNLKQVREVYGVKDGDYSVLTNASQAYEHLTDEDYREIQSLTRTMPEKIFTKEWQNKTDKELQKKNTNLIIRRGETVIFNGRKDAELLQQLPAYEGTGEDAAVTMGTEDYSKLLLKQIDFKFRSGENVSVFLVTQTRGMIPEAEDMLETILVGLIAIFVVSGGGMTLWASRGIVIPIRRLETATKRIARGDLDFTMEVTRRDEIGELCANFEQMRKRLKESSEEKVEQDRQYKILISNICHDLKTPITAIQGYVEGLMDGVANTPEKQEKYIRTIHNKASEMNTLINELTVYSKLDTNRVPYNFQRLNVEGYFTDCMEELRLDLENKGIDLVYRNECDAGMRMIADPEQLTRVIHNIVSNAVKYMGKPVGRISFRIKDVGDFVQIEIEDTGKGIAAKDLPFIFDRFYRADASRNETKGSGIGLSIVKKIISDHGGQIWVTSKENVGTTMYFVLRKYQEAVNG